MQHRFSRTGFAALLVSSLAASAFCACGDERPAPADTCELDTDCLPGQTCVLAHCATARRDLGPQPPPPPDDDAGTDGAMPPDPDAFVDPDTGMADTGPPNICGDRRTDFPEDCDPPNPATCEMRTGCTIMCTIDVLRNGCGNGCEDADEECGDGLLMCGLTADCVDCRCVERCGNGLVDTGETCGEPDLVGCPAGQMCRDCTCYMPACGNATVDEGEECNEPGLSCPMGSTCSDCTCVPAGCGNGFPDLGEECGEPVFTACPANHECTACMCVRIPMCGDGAPDPGEECGEPGGPSCAAGESCTDCACVRTCGDGVADAGEVCGEPVLAACVTGSSCMDCQCSGRCGNGTAELGEKCGEPGLTCGSGSTCDTASCTCSPNCGNGVMDAGEGCDPPTATMPLCTDFGICNAQCQTAVRPTRCGDFCADPGEECGDGGASACALGEICARCQCLPVECGNGMLDAGETCDATMLGTATCPNAPGGATGGGMIACQSDCTADLSGCRCGLTSYTVTGSVRPVRRRDVWQLEALSGTRVSYRVDTTGAAGFDPVACISSTPSSADCFARSDDAFPCSTDSACGEAGCPQGIVTLPPDADLRYYVIVESYFCGACFADVVGAPYSLTVEATSAICRPSLTVEDDVCAGSGSVVPGQERCTCP